MALFELFTSLRYDPRLLSASWNSWTGHPASPFLLLPYHYDRLVDAAHKFAWPAAVQTLASKGNKSQAVEFLKSLCQTCVDHYENPHQPLRIRIILAANGDIRARAFPAVPLEHDLLYVSTFNPDIPGDFQHPTRQLKVYLDIEPTPQSLYTSHKTTSRAHYDAARARLGISSAEPEEVLLYNSDDQVTEGSVRNVAFWRGGRWVTPDLTSGCLAGTTRRWLLENQRVIEGTITREEVRGGEWVLLSNGVEGCLLGIISIRTYSTCPG